ncbi:hypothetical protein [Candidatus Tisiphia endosymbiont of Piscicola geometra]
MYDKEYTAFDQLMNFEVEKIEALTSKNVLSVCNSKNATFSDMQNLSIEKIIDLTSQNAIILYDKGVTFTFLKYYGLEEGQQLQALYNTNPVEADKRQIEECVKAIAKKYPDNNPKFDKAINEFVDKLAISREITNKGANNDPEETKKYLITTLEQLAKDNPALSPPLNRIKLSSVAQDSKLQAATEALASYVVVGDQNNNMPINSFVKTLKPPNTISRR